MIVLLLRMISVNSDSVKTIVAGTYSGDIPKKGIWVQTSTLLPVAL